MGLPTKPIGWLNQVSKVILKNAAIFSPEVFFLSIPLDNRFQREREPQ